MQCSSCYRRSAVLKTVSCLMLAALLAGCLPIGIRGTTLPIYGDATAGAVSASVPAPIAVPSA